MGPAFRSELPITTQQSKPPHERVSATQVCGFLNELFVHKWSTCVGNRGGSRSGVCFI